MANQAALGNAGSKNPVYWFFQLAEFFNKVSAYPPAIVYRRFYKERTWRAFYLECKVVKSSSSVEGLLQRIKDGELHLDESETQFEETMRNLVISLDAYGIPSLLFPPSHLYSFTDALL